MNVHQNEEWREEQLFATLKTGGSLGELRRRLAGAASSAGRSRLRQM